MQEVDLLENKLEAVFDTLRFHGVKIVGVQVEDTPEFKVEIDSDKIYQPVDEVLTFTYWTLWTLIYGKKSELNKDSKIKLLYKEKELSKDET